MGLLPTIAFGDVEVTRLIIGGNPFRGNSHFSAETSRDMQEYFTVARIKETLFEAERQGINTVQARGDVLIEQCIREYRAEGGTMHFIAQTASELRDLRGHVHHLAEFGATGIYVHGTFTDRHYQAGTMRDVEDLLKWIRNAGVQVGLGTHMPEVVDLAEEKGWDVDFYMTCLYNLSRTTRQSAVVSGMHQEEVFDHEDKWKMLERVRQTEKTCLVFKALGAGRLCETPAQVKGAFATVFEHIKEKDAVVVGVFTKYGEQVGENANFVREILDRD